MFFGGCWSLVTAIRLFVLVVLPSPSCQGDDPLSLSGGKMGESGIGWGFADLLKCFVGLCKTNIFFCWACSIYLFESLVLHFNSFC